MIDENTKVRCPWCYSDNTAKGWNDNTYRECVSREMRRAFTPLYKEKAFLKKTDAYYKCPVCETWCRGSQLTIVDTDDERLKRLGGEPIIKTVKKEEEKED